MNDHILIVDFGSQVTQLIARRVRESGVYCEIHPFNFVDQKTLDDLSPKGIIFSGGPSSVVTTEGPTAPDILYKSGLPILGICYGQQTLCAHLGGRVEPSDKREFGRSFVEVLDDCELFHGVWTKGSCEQVWMSHGDRVTRLPDGFRTVASSEGAPYAVIADETRSYYGVMFHPEVVHTPDGAALLQNFVHRVAKCEGKWTMTAFRNRSITQIRDRVGRGRVVCGLSGGVDSAVTAMLIHQAISDQLTCIFVDTGLLRLGEARQIVEVFQDRFNIPLVHRDASDLFIDGLANVSDPEAKRKIIGRLFIDVFDDEAQKLGDVEFLAQGTLYPDVIESVSFGGGPSVTIKSHHNVGGLPEDMNLKLLEPLRELFKDEVRSLGRKLGMPNELIGRHPFPGPGLAIRIPGEVTRAKLVTLRKADHIYLEEIRKAGLYDMIWQAFAVLLPVRTVGVMGDARTYEHVCGLRAVTSTDGMTADSYPFEPAFLAATATRIINEVDGINRVVYDVTSKPPGTIEWE